MERRYKTLLIAVVLAGLAITTVPYAWQANADQHRPTPTPVASPEMGSEAGDEEQAKCPGGFRVEMDANEKNRLFSKGIHVSPKKFVPTVLHGNKKGPGADGDPRILQIYFNRHFSKQAVEDVSKLVKGGELERGMCYTRKARRMYRQLAKDLRHSNITPGEAPSHGVNTGAYSGGSAFQTEPGNISGDRSGYRVTTPSGDTYWVMHRCGNVVTKKPIPKIPEKGEVERKTCPPGNPSCGFPGAPERQFHPSDEDPTEGANPDAPLPPPGNDADDEQCIGHDDSPGCDSGSGSDSPEGEHEGPSGEEQGDSEQEVGDGNEEETEGSGETNPSGDPCNEPDPPDYC